jgi:hypothetical protein
MVLSLRLPMPNNQWIGKWKRKTKKKRKEKKRKNSIFGMVTM